jgi:hypothetical protein
LKKVLIISPYFPPCNAADMQRVRMSLPYFSNYGWKAAVVCVHPDFCDINKDSLLCATVPSAVQIHYVKPISKRWTSKIGLGSIALRSLNSYRNKVDEILKNEQFDLIYFSTTQFPVCILGSYWKRKFGVPYVIDMQDPWHSEFYQDKPKDQRPAKYWFSYRLNKWLEPMAMKNVDGLIAVSEQYINDLKERYQIAVPAATITFGAFKKDVDIAKANLDRYPAIIAKNTKKEVGYIGRGGHDMADAVKILFNAFKTGLATENEHFKQFHFNFLGTSYAPKGKGKKTIEPIAQQAELSNFVTESTDRMPFYQTINTLAAMDILFICGSNDPKYTASKIYPYLLLEQPLLAIFHEQSSVVNILRQCSNATVVTFQEPIETQQQKIVSFFQSYMHTNYQLNWQNFNAYTAEAMTKKQADFFDNLIENRQK